MTDNPLLAPWTTPFGIAPFPAILDEHFRPAFDAAMAEHRAEIAAIGANAAGPTFADTIDAMERAGRTLKRVSAAFYSLTGAHTNERLRAIQREVSPLMASHWNAIFMDDAVFRRVQALHAAGDGLELTAEQRRVLDKYRRAFVRAGAELAPEQKARMIEIIARLATLGTRFSQNILADEAGYTLPLAEADLEGLPDFVRDAAAQAATERDRPGQFVMTLARSLVEPFLSFSPRRDLRRRLFEAWTRRGENGGETDNRAIVAETVALRIERARLLGFSTFADFKLVDTMARTPVAVRALLDEVWAPARARAVAERADLAALAAAEGMNAPIEPWDWRYYSEKLRKARHSLDEATVKPFFPMERMIAAAFDVAGRLFGLSFVPRPDVPAYHPDIRAWEVKDETGRTVGLFLGDYFARPSKRSGAWMSAFRAQERLDGEVLPIVFNVLNFARAPEGQPTLLSFDDASTLFHEFGHALHGLLADVTYPSLSGTDVARDWVELPSQLYEHWLARPEVLRRFALHATTGEAIPEDLLARILATKTFNQGFLTVEYLASAMVDMDFHALEVADNLDPIAFEAESLARLGLPPGTAMRHRTPHFSHVFSGDGYSAGYYSYLWSEVLDADAFDAFVEAGDVFDRDTARRLREFIYGSGDSRDPAEAYAAFRGRMPDTGPLLAKRGLAAT